MFRNVLIYTGAPLATLLNSLSAPSVWTQGEVKLNPSASVPMSFDNTQFRIYDAVFEDSPLRLMHFVSEAPPKFSRPDTLTPYRQQ